MRFSFIHAADLHIDSPFDALREKSADVAARFAGASRRAVTALVDETLRSEAAFLVIAGDVFDRDWADMSTGLFFVREMARLERAGVPVFMLRGNHDAEGVITKSLRWPDNVREFSSRKNETLSLDSHRVALHGRSFTERRVDDDFVRHYPARREGWLNIGVLHTALDGKRGHESYAPCTIADLAGFGYDYWALGHIHAADIVARDPWIVFPGNLQGRSVRETGPKGAMRVSVEDGRVVDAQPIALDAARWAHERVDLSGVERMDDIHRRIRTTLDDAHRGAQGRSLAIRLTLAGDTALHDALVASREQLQAEARGFGARVAYDCWVEQVKIATQPLARPASANHPNLARDLESFDVEGLLREAAADPAFLARVRALADDVRARMPAALRGETDALPQDDADAQRIGQAARALLLGALRAGAQT